MGETVKVAAKKPEAKRENKASHTQRADFSHPVSSPVEHILFLQRTIGNQAVGRLISSGALQSKLRISQPGDKFEQEADKIANAVVNMTGHQIREGEGKGSVQAKSLDRGSNVNTGFHKQLGQSNAGSPLPERTRNFMEPRFGANFGDVRIHTDSQAAEMTKAVNARAFTAGRDIYFGENQYSPGSGSGDRLIAHELTHTIQQRSFPAGQVSTKLLSSGENTEQIYRQAAKSETKASPKPAGDTAPGVMDLKGKDKFEPSEPIASFLEGRDTSTVNVRFGKMAEGQISVNKKSRGKYEIDRQPLSLTHSLFAGMGGTKPNLIVYTKAGAVNGYIGFGTGRGNQELAALLNKSPDLLGLAGFDLSRLPAITNSIEGGSLHLGIKGGITLGGAFSGTIDLEAIDEKINFTGSVRIKVEKLAAGELELNRSGEGLITGKGSVELAKVKNFTGKVDVAWDGRAITGEGKAGYQGEKFSGEVTLKVMERSMAEQLEQSEKPPSKEIPAKETKGRKVDYVVFGEGDLNFSFTEWLTGTAHVIVDHKGNLTVIGKITPQKEVILFEQKDYNRQLFKVEARASYGIPVVGNIFIFANVGMDAFANIGPGKLYNIVVEGTYSTDPTKSKSFSIQGSLNISAAAGLRLRGEAGAGLEILAHDIKAGAGINGIAGIRGYAEATPVIGYREKAKEGEDKKGELFIRGDLEIAAQPFLGLSGDLFVEIDAPWWSPVPDKKWTWPLFNKEWPIGGSLGIGASVDYVFGSGVPPAVDFKPVEFSADKFMTDLYSDKAKGKSGEKEAQKGKWAEKNSKAAEPPPKAAKKGNAQLGKGAGLPAGKSKVKAGTTKKSDKPVDPNARTKEGKSVKQLQDEAAKKGKKPAGKEPKGKGEGEKPKDKKEHDEQLKKGLAALDAVTKRYAKDGATKEEVETGVKAVRRKFKVFKSIEVMDGGKTWDYKYIASEGKMTGPSKATDTSANILEQARTMLDKELQTEPNLEQTEKVIKHISDQLKPKGLKQLKLGPEMKDSKRIVSAEASSPTDLLELIPKQAEARAAISKSAIKITLSEAFDVELDEDKKGTFVKRGPPGIVGQRVEKNNKHPYFTLESGMGSAHRTIGGYVFIPEKGSDKIEILTFNVGKDPKKTNESHAEHLFVKFWEKANKDPQWKERVKKIEIINDPYSPCDFCCFDLAKMLNELRSEKQKSRIEAMISWKRYYLFRETMEAFNIASPHEKTTPEGLAKLKKAGWILNGPLVPDFGSPEFKEKYIKKLLKLGL